MRHDAATLIEFLADLLVRAGFSKDEASAIARSLTLSERLGYASHGIAQISRYIAELRAGNIVSGATPRTLQETPNSLVVDAQLGAGQVAMPIVLRNVLSKLATQASVTAAVRNCGHVGRLGEWVEHPAEAGYAALLFVNDNGLNRIVAPRAAGAASRAQTPLHSAFRFRMDRSFPPICRPQRLRLARSKEPSALGWRFRRIACRTPPARPRATRRRCPRSRQEQFFLWAALKDTKGLRCPFSSIFWWPVCRVVRRRQPRRAPRARIA